MIPSRSPSIVLVTLCARLLKNEPMEDEVEVGFEPDVVAFGIRLWPSVEVLSCVSSQKTVGEEKKRKLTVTIW